MVVYFISIPFYKREISMSNSLGRGGILDLTGQKINNYTIISRAPDKKTTRSNYVVWNCLCDCGKNFTATSKEIKKGRKSCGCLRYISQFRKTLTDEQAILRKIIFHYKYSSEKRNIVWNITEEEAIKLLTSPCYYCSQPPFRVCDYLKHCKPIVVSGIDRYDNLLGYEKGNCVSCCKICNVAKSTLTINEFKEWIEKIYKNFCMKNHN